MEETRKPRRLPGWAVNLLIWVLPTLEIYFIYVFAFGLSFELFSFLTFCAIPVFGLIVTRLLFLFRSKRSSGAKAWRCVVWILVLIVFWFISLFFLRMTHQVTHVDAKSKFEAKLSAAYPKWFSGSLEIGSPESVALHDCKMTAVIFESRSYTLLCRYDAAEYEAEKAAMETRYSFRTELLDSENPFFHKEGVEQLEPYAVIGNDVFRFLQPEDGTTGYLREFYKNCLLVVTNDAEQEIGYLLFHDADLDVVTDLTEFLNLECGWARIR